MIVSFTIEQRLVRIQLPAKKLTGKEAAWELIHGLSTSNDITSQFIVATMSDCASVNNVVLYPTEAIHQRSKVCCIEVIAV